MLKKVAEFGEYNFRRHSDPWVAIVDENGKIDFKKEVGYYTGRFQAGEAGELVIMNPVEGQIYAYGRKDRRKRENSWIQYIIYKNGEFIEIDKRNLSKYLNKEK